MAEIWGAALASAAVGVYSANKAKKAGKEQSQFEAQAAREGIAISGYEDRKTIQFQQEMAQRAMQQERDRKAKAFSGLARQTLPNLPSDYQFQQVDVPNAPENTIPLAGEDLYNRPTSGGA